MPLNKEAYIRYRILDQLLSNKKNKYPTVFDFMRAYEDTLGKSFSRRTITNDIEAMRSDNALGFFAPIKYSRKHEGYYYDDENYSISSFKLSDAEMESIGFTTKVLQQYKGIGIFSQFDEAVDKIMQAISIKNLLNEEEEKEIIQLEKIQSFKGSEWLNPLLKAIKEHEPIVVTYQKFSSETAKELLIHPYLLKEYRNRWYLIAMTDRKKLVSTYALDRIQHIAGSPSTPFVFSHDFKPEIYFKHAYGITTFEGAPEKIVLRFDSQFAPYIITQPLHETQTLIRETPQGTEIQIEVGITAELIQDVLSFGNKVQVLAPSSLIDVIKNNLQRTQDLYK